jgi:glycosyltransferase involved in cell wall biosynthesis
MSNTQQPVISKKKQPFISVCTPTFNRRPFIPYLIKCFEQQTYPKEKMEWIIVDDGTDSIEDLVKHIPQVKYFRENKKMNLGKKRNFMHSKCSGEIIIYMDDDDYYPPERVSHAVESLVKHPEYLIAGSSEMHIYFDTHKKIYQFGPYTENHSTAATFAFRKKLLKKTKYDEGSFIAEEKQFLKNYTIPLFQLDTQKVILVCSHRHNSVSKEELLKNKEQSKITDSKFVVEDFIKDPELLEFYTTGVDKLLENYDIGKPEKKPGLIKKIQENKENRNKMMETMQKENELDFLKMYIAQSLQQQNK